MKSWITTLLLLISCVLLTACNTRQPIELPSDATSDTAREEPADMFELGLNNASLDLNLVE